MVRTTDGFELADEDLRLRGEGTLFDTKQSGMPDLKLARLAEDMPLVARARARAFALIDDDPSARATPGAARRAAPPLRAFDRLALPFLSSTGRQHRSGYPASMRIVAGSAKGVRLGPVPAGVRPISDRAREGLFSSLGPGALEGANVLDLFAGTGAAGIEALSRGAASRDVRRSGTGGGGGDQAEPRPDEARDARRGPPVAASRGSSAAARPPRGTVRSRDLRPSLRSRAAGARRGAAGARAGAGSRTRPGRWC